MELTHTQAKGATMSKIEPMSAEQIKLLLAECGYRYFQATMGDMRDKILRLALAFIHAEARARQAYHGWQAALGQDHLDYAACSICDMRFEDWVKVVKAEVGWPEDGQ